jgi:O-acetyl-ADP-ribose deacetylase (regulator of RNase III)
MIRFTQGDLLAAKADALVNTVNEVGVMGKGIALQFRDAYPKSARAYEQAAREGRVRVGQMLVTGAADLYGPRLVIHFPTKRHWRNPSQLQWIRDGLTDLVRVIHEEHIASIAIPPLGCGNGGLDWRDVRSEIEHALGPLDIEVTVYEPTEAYYNSPKQSGVETLTPARALVSEMVRRYSVLGFECSVLEVQKLAWFLDRARRRHALPDELRLTFEPKQYGPYADRLRHLLSQLDGSYLHCERRLADARPLDVLWFDESRTEAVAEYLVTDPAARWQPALTDATRVIQGFESPLGMELLATVDWLVAESGAVPTVTGVRDALGRWPAGERSAQRKRRMFDDHLLDVALSRLREASFV